MCFKAIPLRRHYFTYLCLTISNLFILTACSLSGAGNAPVENFSSVRSPVLLSPAPTPVQRPKLKPGYYTVRAGDTVFAIARRFGRNPKDIIAWNQLQTPNTIEVGQLLRITPPMGTAIASPVRVPDVNVVKQTKASNTTTQEVIEETSISNNNGQEAENTTTTSTWIWPTQGAVIANFDGKQQRGIEIANIEGTPISATADGVVVIAAPQRGYGNLVVIKHDNDILSAYAYNRLVKVSEGQKVKKGQVIAEMGSVDTDRSKLQFQIRKNTIPVDPLIYLPPKTQ
jgi:lipoprotein NlpD